MHTDWLCLENWGYGLCFCYALHVLNGVGLTRSLNVFFCATSSNLLLNTKTFFIDFSARSKVRGTLEIYHAYIRNSEASRGDGDWEIVDNNSTPVSVSRLSYHTTLLFKLPVEA